MLARKANGVIGDVAEAASEAIMELNGAKRDRENAVSATIPSTGWQSDSNSYYPYYYDITVAGITANDGANVVIAVNSLNIASDCGLCPTNETLANKVRVRASSVPSAAMTANIWIMRGEEA